MMDANGTLEQRVRAVVVQALELELDPAGLPADEPLFGDATGADSIAALEIVFGLEREFDIQVTDEELGVELFDSVRALTRYVEGKLRAAKDEGGVRQAPGGTS